MLPNFIFGAYKSLVRFVPWDRDSATVNLKEICATLRVRTFCAPALHWTELIFVQEGWFLGFSESDINTKLQKFWDTFT